ESDLNEDEYNQAQIITELRDKYKCLQHITPCYVEDERHLPLNPARLTLWARDIITPHYQTMPHQTVQPNMLPLPTMPSGFNPYIYPYNSFYYQIPQPQISQPQISQPQILQLQTTTRYNISLNKFFFELDQIYDGKGAYIALEKSFEEQGITVNGIKELTDDQLIELGVTK
ncbi:15226_t:CDS:2, partial [Cetraspora pellucida]